MLIYFDEHLNKCVRNIQPDNPGRISFIFCIIKTSHVFKISDTVLTTFNSCLVIKEFIKNYVIIIFSLCSNVKNSSCAKSVKKNIQRTYAFYLVEQSDWWKICYIIQDNKHLNQRKPFWQVQTRLIPNNKANYVRKRKHLWF
jgi:hypothetical protein